ncbi:MAG: 7-cyano-7-deazaguanine synthase QueC [Candidatus Omnitrophica bacterium]|nr:7-cyano-7-deazaguanine synthase QueC [Candidatus Omnitrophota bacterium]
MMKKGVILLSGGLDSAVTLYYAKNKGYKLEALIFDYGQRHKKEINFAKKIARINNIRYHLLKIDLSWTESSLTKKGIKVPSAGGRGIPVTYVSGRNIIFLSYAFSLAESIRAKSIFIGAHVQDYSGYPDCHLQFMKDFQAAVRKGLKKKDISIKTPLIKKTKKQIVNLGISLDVPFKYTWSCYEGGKIPCLRCDSCCFRTAAFKALGRKDPIMEA